MHKKCNFILFVLLTVITGSSFGQVDSVTVSKVSIINSDTLVKGIYWSYHEFKRNEPFITDSFEIIPASSTSSGVHSIEHLHQDRFRDRVHFLYKHSNTVENASRYFGYCDGKTAYMSFDRFHPISVIGSICLVRINERKSPANSFAIAGFLGGLVGVAIVAAINQDGKGIGVIDDWFILDLETGDFVPIHEHALMDIFYKQDKELLKEYKKVKGKGKLETMLYYVWKFNERNPL